MIELLRELSSRGHDTTLILLTCPDFNIEIPPSVRTIYHPVDEEDCAMFKTHVPTSEGFLSKLPKLVRFVGSWNTPKILKFVSSYLLSNKVDVILCDIFTIGVVSIAKNFSIPSIEVAHRVDRFVDDVSYVPLVFFSAGTLPLSYIQRMNNFAYSMVSSIILKIMEAPLHNSLSILNLEYVRYADLAIVTSEFGLMVARDVPPYVKVVGGLFSEKRQTLDPEITEILDTALVQGKKVIYLSMGTVAKLNQDQLSRLVEGLRGLNDTVVLWAVSIATQLNLLPPEIPEHVIIRAHLPQVYILNHPAVKLFVSHCGANSALEATWAGVPVLAVPNMGDQIGLASQLVQRGMAESMDISNLDSAEFTKTIIHLLNSEKYTKNAKKMSELVRTSGGVMEATYHVERIALLGVTDLFVPERLNVSWFVRKQFDILLSFLVVAVLFWKLCSCCCGYCKCCRSCRLNKKEEVKLKIQ